jgi:hypothetical protein
MYSSIMAIIDLCVCSFPSVTFELLIDSHETTTPPSYFTILQHQYYNYVTALTCEGGIDCRPLSPDNITSADGELSLYHM